MENVHYCLNGGRFENIAAVIAVHVYLECETLL